MNLNIKKVLFWLLITVVAVVISLETYLYVSYRGATVDEILFAINAPKGNLPLTYLLPIVWSFFLPLVLILLVSVVAVRKFKAKQILALVLLVIFAVATNYTVRRTKLVEFVKGFFDVSQFIEMNYVDPAKTLISFPSDKRNLIHIYLESMELSFADQSVGGAFKDNIIKEISSLGLHGESFSGDRERLAGAYSLTGATWTMGGAFAAETGLPLKIKIGGNEMSTQRHFFKNTTALGDVLKKNGYRSVAMKDVDMTFAGSEMFYQEHGDNKVVDYKYAVEKGYIPQGYHVWGGFEDSRLFEIAKTELLQLSAEEGPFSFTFYTNDTHFPDGYRCSLCPDKFADGYSNVYACSSRQVRDFIDWIKKQEFYKDTIIVIHGDHPTMNPTYVKRNSSVPAYDRKVFVTVLNAPVSPVERKARSYSTFDLFPTILVALGAKIEGNRLGLGVNLYSSEPTLVERFGVGEINKELAKRSVFMERMAEIRDLRKLKDRSRFCKKDINCFLKSIRDQGMDRFVVAIAARDEASNGLSDKTLKYLKDFGIKSSLAGKFRYSFAAIVDGKDVEDRVELAKITLERKVDDVDFSVTSAGFDVGNTSKILIDNVSYTLPGRGLCIAVYDKQLKRVVALQSYDTYLRESER